ncbi:hypothetical protein [Lactobacillus crispatus]|uniref:hypothetical protein n=1 Tax=Lactobacillus crispatus TaxID=47770 RepID=UPI00336A79EC
MTTGTVMRGLTTLSKQFAMKWTHLKWVKELILPAFFRYLYDVNGVDDATIAIGSTKDKLADQNISIGDVQNLLIVTLEMWRLI